jgi:hypothetical protein
MNRVIPILAVLLWSASLASAADAQRAQLSDKVVGVSIFTRCPDAPMVTEINAETARLTADYSQILQTVGVSLCPATSHGQLFPFTENHALSTGVTTQVGGAVVIVLYYRRQIP